jgi:hypothetical protein
MNGLDKVKTDIAALKHLRPDVTPIRECVCARFLTNLMSLARSECWTRSQKRSRDVQSKA